MAFSMTPCIVAQWYFYCTSKDVTVVILLRQSPSDYIRAHYGRSVLFEIQLYRLYIASNYMTVLIQTFLRIRMRDNPALNKTKISQQKREYMITFHAVPICPYAAWYSYVNPFLWLPRKR